MKFGAGKNNLFDRKVSFSPLQLRIILGIQIQGISQLFLRHII